MKIAAIMTCFNRRDKTLNCLRKLFESDIPESVQLDAYLTDDGSRDDTSKHVAQSFPNVVILTADGNAYWNGGMRKSFAAALEKGYDFYLWLNDDTLIFPDALQRLIDVHAEMLLRTGKHGIIVGTTTGTLHNEPTYGGVIFPIWWRRTTPEVVFSEALPIRCETINGNCVLIPAAVAEVVGNLDGLYTHGMGDFDYGFRAVKSGFDLWVAPGFVGQCDRNTAQGTFLDSSVPLMKRWRMVTSKKGYSPRAWATFTRRHCGHFWFLYWTFPYIRTLVIGLKSPFIRRRSS